MLSDSVASRLTEYLANIGAREADIVGETNHHGRLERYIRAREETREDRQRDE